MNTNHLIFALSLMESWYPEQEVTSIMFEDGSGNTFVIKTTEKHYFLRLHPTSRSLVTLNELK